MKEMCRNTEYGEHPFVPGIDADDPTPNPDWCNACGTEREPVKGRSHSLASVPFVGHVCPNANDLRPGVDDLCDLPEPWHRLAYTLNIDSQHDCTAGFGHHSDFCKHAVWREVVAAYRVIAPARVQPGKESK